MFNEALRPESFAVATQLRNAGIATEVYPKLARMKKQLQYAHRREVAHVVFLGTEEIRSGVAKVKDMATGEESTVALDAILSHLQR